MKKLNTIMGVIAGSTVGVFLGHALWQWLDWRSHPELYMMRSAPWYVSIQVNAVFVVAALAVELVIYLLLRRRWKRRNK